MKPLASLNFMRSAWAPSSIIYDRRQCLQKAVLLRQIVLLLYEAVYLSRWDTLVAQMWADSNCLLGQYGFLVVVLGPTQIADHCWEFADSSGAKICVLGSKWLLKNRLGGKQKRGLFFSLYPTWVAVGDTKMNENEIMLFFLRAGNAITTEKHAHGLTLQQLFGGKAMTIHLLTCFHRKRNSGCLFVHQVVCKSLLLIFPSILFYSLTMW